MTDIEHMKSLAATYGDTIGHKVSVSRTAPDCWLFSIGGIEASHGLTGAQLRASLDLMINVERVRSALTDRSAIARLMDRAAQAQRVS